MGPWQDQGTVVDDTAKQRGSFWDWWDDNGDTAVDAVGDVLCLINPNSPRCRPAYPPGGGPYAVRQDNTTLYLLIGAVLFLLLILILKK